MTTKISELAINEVVLLERIRVERNYKGGWLYHRCKEKNLLAALDFCRSQGLISASPATVLLSPRSTPTKFLSIELVPETCWFSNVRSNVEAEQWNKLKKRTFNAANYRCEICGGTGPKWPVECHEIFSYDDKQRIQKLTGLVALCPDCHEVKHIGLAGVRGRRQQALQHLAKVNQWDILGAEHYTSEQFAIWSRRSELEWELDLSWLTGLGITVSKTDRNVADEDLREIQPVREKPIASIQPPSSSPARASVESGIPWLSILIILLITGCIKFLLL